MQVMICDTDDVVNQILDTTPPCLKVIIAMNSKSVQLQRTSSNLLQTIRSDIKSSTFERAQSMGVKIVKFNDVETFGLNFGGIVESHVAGLQNEIQRHPPKVRAHTFTHG